MWLRVLSITRCTEELCDHFCFRELKSLLGSSNKSWTIKGQSTLVYVWGNCEVWVLTHSPLYSGSLLLTAVQQQLDFAFTWGLVLTPWEKFSVKYSSLYVRRSQSNPIQRSLGAFVDCWPIHRKKCILHHDAIHTTVIKLIDNFEETVINFIMDNALWYFLLDSLLLYFFQKQLLIMNWIELILWPTNGHPATVWISPESRSLLWIDHGFKNYTPLK